MINSSLLCSVESSAVSQFERDSSCFESNRYCDSCALNNISMIFVVISHFLIARVSSK